ncbi:hypothetical protein ACE02H_21530 [Shewanella mangrovisoli]|uniref:hypothetical protein n=1 Tax=Shewanella mangrovisoli TaxID=2864211 RepID=UPI0035B8EC65
MQEGGRIASEAVSVGIRTALNILEKWSCDSQQAKALLKLPESYNNLDLDKVNFSLEHVERVSYILNIHASLRMVFTNPENIYGFMKMVNHNFPFNGVTPIDFISNGETVNFQTVMEHIDKLIL